MATIILSQVVGAILECDEVEMHPISEEETEITIITTGLHPKLGEIKSKLFKLLAPPFKIYDVEAVEEQQKGFLFKRYKVTGTIKHPPSAGGREALRKRLFELHDKKFGP